MAAETTTATTTRSHDEIDILRGIMIRWAERNSIRLAPLQISADEVKSAAIAMKITAELVLAELAVSK
jgi:hypothetical protein